MKIDLLDTPSEDVRIEIIPLIDVIFCILTFFILAAVGLTRQQAIDLDLPQASTGNALPPQGIGTEAIQRGRLYVSIDAIGRIYVEQQRVNADLLYEILLQHRQISPQGLIVLYASQDARYADVIQVLDLLRSVGGDRVALATLPGESPNFQTEPQDTPLLDIPLDVPSTNVPPTTPPLESPTQDPLLTPDSTAPPTDSTQELDNPN